MTVMKYLSDMPGEIPETNIVDKSQFFVQQCPPLITDINTNKNIENKNKNYLTKSYGEIQLNTATINRNFRIKVNGYVNGVKVNKLVGVSGLLAILGLQTSVRARFTAALPLPFTLNN